MTYYKHFKHLHVPDHWEHYWSKYPQGYTIMEALISWVSHVDHITDNVNDWNEYLDGFVATFDTKLQNTVREMIQELYDSGKLAELTAQVIDVVQDQIDGLSSQLAENANYLEQNGVNIFKFKDYVPNKDIIPDPNNWDWTEAINQAILYATDNKIPIYFPSGDFIYKGNLVIDDNTVRFIKGSGSTRLIFELTSGVAIETRSYYTRSITIEDLEIRLKDSNQTVSGLKSTTPSVWGAGIILRNVNITNFTDITLEIVEGFNCLFENCKFTGLTEGTKKGKLLKLSKTNQFGNNITFKKCTFHFGRIGFQNTGATLIRFENCTFESLVLFHHATQVVGVSLIEDFQGCWFEDIEKGILNAEIDETTLEPLTPIANRVDPNAFRFTNSFRSSHVADGILNSTIEPYWSNHFDLRGKLNDHQKTPNGIEFTYDNGLDNSINEFRTIIRQFNIQPISYDPYTAFKSGAMLITVEAIGLNGSKIHAVYLTSNYETDVVLQGSIKDPDAIGYDPKLDVYWSNNTTLTVKAYAYGLTKINVKCTLFVS